MVIQGAILTTFSFRWLSYHSLLLLSHTFLFLLLLTYFLIKEIEEDTDECFELRIDRAQKT